MKLIQAKDLTKHFNEITAVDHVDLDVSRGEVVGFLGPNGAGKSTTMKMVSGFLEPDEGTVVICGHDIQTHPIEAKRHIGYLPEGAPAYSDMIVGDFLEFIGKLRGLSGKQLNNRLTDMAEQINLADVWDKQIETLSKGYKRRVGIAQALIHDPDVLILDEPTDGLDPNQKHEMRSLIRSISVDKSIVVSTHILEEVEAVCSRAVIIANGKVVADEKPYDLTANSSEKDAIAMTVGLTDPDEILTKIAPLTGKAEVEIKDCFNGSTRLLIKPMGKVPQPAQLASKLQRAHIDVEEIGFYRPKLEDVFRQITTGQHVH